MQGASKKFLDIFTEFNKAKVVVLPIPMEETTTYVKGTQNGPQAIIAASGNVELFDEQLQTEPHKIGIATLEPVKLSKGNLEETIDSIYRTSLDLLKKGKFIVALGGEHTISVGLVKAHQQMFPHLSVLQLDAHADLRDHYLGSRYNHACTMARIKEMCPFVGWGIRSLSAEEAETIAKEHLKIIYAEEIVIGDPLRHHVAERKGNSATEEVLGGLSDEIYLTIDLDLFDPSIMPSVGTPEPGGPLWYQTVEFLKIVSERKKIVGFDVVELCPQSANKAPDFIAAKLIYKIIGYVFRNEEN